jgi:proteasome lid subunit RPN8/RPN11
VADAIIAHAREGKPEEVCGIVRGRALAAVEAVRGRNIASERIENYEVDPETLLLQFAFEDQGDEMMAIYHSHPVSVAYPSATDAWNAHYPESIYLICSLEFDDAPVIRAFRMTPHWLELDVARLRRELSVREVRPNLFAYYQAAEEPLPPLLALARRTTCPRPSTWISTPTRTTPLLTVASSHSSSTRSRWKASGVNTPHAIRPAGVHEVAIIGAGPIGIELAVCLKRAGVDVLHLDAGQIGHTLTWWPRNTSFFSTTERLALAGVPIQNNHQQRITGEEYLAYLRGVVEQFDLHIQTHEPVTALVRQGETFQITTQPQTGPRTYQARRVVLAIGDMHYPQRLNIPGESCRTSRTISATRTTTFASGC